ncbi:MAG: hypothetical protein AAF563_02645 [Pseudomonadota bacterium]
MESTSQDGDILTDIGSVACQLGTSGDFGDEIDLSDPLPISGDFAVALQRL